MRPLGAEVRASASPGFAVGEDDFPSDRTAPHAVRVHTGFFNGASARRRALRRPHARPAAFPDDCDDDADEPAAGGAD